MHELPVASRLTRVNLFLYRPVIGPLTRCTVLLSVAFVVLSAWMIWAGLWLASLPYLIAAAYALATDYRVRESLMAGYWAGFYAASATDYRRLGRDPSEWI